MIPKCPICESKESISLYEKYFCEICDVYYTDSRQPCALPIPNTVPKIKLCSTCAKIGDVHVNCNHFRDYMGRHVFCEKCRLDSWDYFKYNFYKYHSLYRTGKRSLGRLRTLLLLILVCASFWSSVSCYMLLFFSEVFCLDIGRRSVLKVPLVPVVDTIAFRPFLIVIAVWLLRRRTGIYSVPAKFDRFNLDDHVDRLKIDHMYVHKRSKDSRRATAAVRKAAKSDTGKKEKNIMKKVEKLKL